jgi:outer membrane protein TolC
MNKHSSSRALIIASALAIVQIGTGASAVLAQSSDVDLEKRLSVINTSLSLPPNSSLTKYFDPQTGVTVEQAVAYALERNGELLAARKEIDAASALVKQATLKANPKVDATVSKTSTGTDTTVPLNGMVPLELGGRRSARLRVAERELEMRRQDVANRERMLAADVRAKFGEALAAILKLGFDEDLIATSQRGYNQVASRVAE